MNYIIKTIAGKFGYSCAKYDISQKCPLKIGTCDYYNPNGEACRIFTDSSQPK